MATGAAGQTAPGAAHDAPPQLDDGWRTAPLSAVGLDPGRMRALTDAIGAGELPGIHAVLVVKDGLLVYEEYFEGVDFAGGQPLGVVAFDRDTLHDLRSITKCVTSALAGIALGDGALHSLDTPVFTYLPQHRDLATGVKADINVWNLLTMTTGLQWDESSYAYRDPRNDEHAMEIAPDAVRFALAPDLADAPGERFRYSGGATTVLAGIVAATTATPLDRYAQRVLFAPLGIERFAWRRNRDGTPSSASGLRLTPRDLAKFGHLYLRDGRWNGRQVLPPGWAAESTRPHVRLGERAGFGYQWWTWRIRAADAEVPAFGARGNGGQRVFVAPGLDLMVVIAAGNYDADGDRVRDVPWRMFTRYVLAAAGVAPER